MARAARARRADGGGGGGGGVFRACAAGGQWSARAPDPDVVPCPASTPGLAPPATLPPPQLAAMLGLGDADGERLLRRVRDARQ